LAPETKLPFIIEDIRDAFQWVRAEGARVFDFDPDRIAVAGGSAGGYLSLMTGIFDQKPRAIVSFYGYGDILGDWYTRPSDFYCQQQPMISKEEACASVGGQSSRKNRRYMFYFYCRQQGIWPEAVSGYSLATEREKLMPFCPVHNIDKDYPPTFLLHGDRDTDVPCEQSIQMADELARQGIPNKLTIIKDGEHGFDGDVKNPAVKKALDEVVDFLKDALRETP
jgi:dipeptidyl aminopeptidase/acylaminoacyl peptidase